MGNLLKAKEKAKVSCCITMDNDMMENGKLIKDTAKDMKSLQMEASILVNTSKIKWMDKEDIPGQEEKLTKESGKTT